MTGSMPEIAGGHAVRHGHVQRRMLSGSGNGIALRDRLQGHQDVLQRIHPDRVLPAQFVRVGRTAPSHPTRLMTCTLNRWKWMK